MALHGLRPRNAARMPNCKGEKRNHSIELTSVSSTRHIYHINKVLYGRNRSLSSSISFSFIYFHLPPLFFSSRHVSAHEGSHAPLNTEVAEAEDVQTLQREAGEHFDAPPAEPAHGNQLLENFLIRRRCEH